MKQEAIIQNLILGLKRQDASETNRVKRAEGVIRCGLAVQPPKVIGQERCLSRHDQIAIAKIVLESPDCVLLQRIGPRLGKKSLKSNVTPAHDVRHLCAWAG